MGHGKPVTRVLLIEDDMSIKLALYKALSKAPFTMASAKTGISGLHKAADQSFDIILLDLELPDISGLTVCRQLRAEGLAMPIIVLTAEAGSSTKVKLLDAGANDYITKPFSLDELMARMRAALRQMPRRPVSSQLTVGDLTLLLQDRVAERGGMAIKLSQKECDILAYLMQHAGTTLARADIVRHVWGAERWTNTLDVHVKHLRSKIDEPFDTPMIITMHGIGYRLAVRGGKR